MPDIDFEQAALDYVNRPGYRPVKPAMIAKKMGLDDLEKRELKRAIKKLIREGKLAWGDKHLVTRATAETTDRITGVFARKEAGYGFVRPSHVKPGAGRSEDVYIAARDARDAASGDVVLVRVHKKQSRPGKPGPSGEILEVIERETHRFVGTYFEEAELALVRVDGNIFAQPVSVGDPTANPANPNDKVVIEIVRFPSNVHEGEGVIVDVLGPRGEPGVDTLSIIHEFGLPGEFGEEVLEDARAQAKAFDESIPEDRVDLTGETVITIDPFDARDFDDAISLKRLANGHWELGVHIADVSHFVRPKTALDTEAYDRATSVYLPDQVIPMLPEIISNNLASLQPDKVRYTMSATIEMTAEGTRVATEVQSAAIRSDRRFTYEEVDEFLEDREAWREKLTPEVHRLLSEMHTLAMLLRRRRYERGSLELTMPEVKIDLDKQGRVSGAHVRDYTESHQIIEEFMLAANEAVAQRLADEELAFIRRVHAAPDPRKLKALTEFVAELGFKTESLESRFEIQKLLKLALGSPQQHAVNYATLRSMQKAVYGPEEEGHYALASECYCHFTSPIRRYPDLTVHRLFKTLLAGKRPAQDIGRLMALGEHCSDREQRAEKAERELTRVKLLNYMGTRIGDEMDAVITGVEEFGLFVQALEIPAEGLIHISSLSDDYYHFDRAAHLLAGRKRGNAYRLGDTVRVAVARVDIDRRQLDYRMIGRLSDPGEAKVGSGSRSKQSKPKHPKKPSHRSSKGERKKPGRKKSRKPPGKKRKKRK